MEQGPKVKALAQAGEWDLAAPDRNAAEAADAAQAKAKDKAKAKGKAKGKAKDRAEDRAADKAEAAGKTGRIIL